MNDHLTRNIDKLLANSRPHYENMQYTMIFHGCKNYNFQMKNSDIFLIFAQNIDFGYTLVRRFSVRRF